VIIGASASGGFTETEPFGGATTPQYSLGPYIEAALPSPHEPVQNLAHAMFFLKPEASGRYQLDQVPQARPTLVIGIDFLFWFCYGDGRTDQERLQRFENGLKMLEAIRCPLIVGDIPDASAAVNRMLSPGQIPSFAAMTAANRRLREWAATRDHVVIVPLARFMKAVMTNQAVTIHGHTLEAGKTRALLQSDNLHPTAAGAAFLALLSLDAFQKSRASSRSDEILWNPGEVLRQGLNRLRRPSPDSEKQDDTVQSK